MGIAAGCTALIAYLIGDVINEAYIKHNLPGIITLGALTVVLFSTKGVATYGQSVMMSRIGNRIIADNQRAVFTKLLNEGLGFFSDRHSSEFTMRLSAGAAAATQVINLMITSVGRDLFSLVGPVIVMVVQDPLMSFFSFVVAPPALFVLRKLIRRIYAIGRSQYHGNERILDPLQETLQGIRIVKAFTLEDVMRERFDRHVATVEYEANKMARVSNRASPLMETRAASPSPSPSPTAAIACSTPARHPASSSPSSPHSCSLMSRPSAWRAESLAQHRLGRRARPVRGARQPAERAERCRAAGTADQEPAVSNSTTSASAIAATKSVLHGMSFVAEPGKLTALVGPSGGGKSTVFNLIMRFYEPESGKIVIDEQDICQVSRRSLRRHVAYVGQDVFLFRGTIRENIAFGKPGASEDEIVAAAKAAYAHDFIMSFPRGYDAPVGEHGLQLSGGQRQRIAIARALIKNAPIILLDEATAALDSESELQVREAMEHLFQGRTTLAIAHRLHTVSHADRIYVVESGRVTESGRHDDLQRRDGRYASFYRLQLKEQEIRGAGGRGGGLLRDARRAVDGGAPHLIPPWPSFPGRGPAFGFSPVNTTKSYGSRSWPLTVTTLFRRRRKPASRSPAPTRFFRFAASGASAATTSSTSARWVRTSGCRRSISPSPPTRSCRTAAPCPIRR